jgi:hypothetical protein
MPVSLRHYLVVNRCYRSSNFPLSISFRLGGSYPVHNRLVIHNLVDGRLSVYVKQITKIDQAFGQLIRAVTTIRDVAKNVLEMAMAKGVRM